MDEVLKLNQNKDKEIAQLKSQIVILQNDHVGYGNSKDC
jgi:hypothetical protein